MKPVRHFVVSIFSSFFGVMFCGYPLTKFRKPPERAISRSEVVGSTWVVLIGAELFQELSVFFAFGQRTNVWSMLR